MDGPPRPWAASSNYTVYLWSENSGDSVGDKYQPVTQSNVSIPEINQR